MDKRFQKIRPLLKLEEFGRETSLFDILVDYYTIMYEEKKIAKKEAYKYIKAWVKEEKLFGLH